MYGKLYIKRNPPVITCPTNQTKVIDPKSPVCILQIAPITNGSNITLTGYEHLSGNCTLASTTTHDVP